MMPLLLSQALLVTAVVNARHWLGMITVAVPLPPSISMIVTVWGPECKPGKTYPVWNAEPSIEY